MNELPPGWCWVAIRDIGDVRLGRQRSPDRATGPHMRPYMRAANVTWKGISLDDVKQMDFSPQEFEVFALRPGDVLVGEASGSRLEVGKSAIWRGEVPGACFQNTLIRVRVGDAVLPEYLQKHLAHDAHRGALADISRGIGIHHIGAAGLAEWQISLAPLPEQKRIADKLDALLARVDACRERLDRVPGILKRFHQSVLAAATSGELTREWREERGFAREWTETRVEDIAFVGTGSTPLRSNSAFYAESGTPWITSAMTGLPFVTRAEEFVTDAAIAAHRLRKYPVGTLLVAMYGEGKTRGQVTELRIEATINQACAAICVDARKAETAFVRLALEANYLEMRELAEGGNQPNLNLSKIKDFPLSLPPLEEQRAITARVEAIYEWLGKTETRLSAARRRVDRSTQALLAKAFRGELVPQDPTDEPASALLAKLKTERANAAAVPSRRRPKTPGKRPTMSKTDKDSIKAAILALNSDRVSFDELRAQVSGDYESLKAALFELLEEPSPVVRQVFDQKAKAMHLVRVRP